MYLKSLTLKGFKSFASATSLKFEPGICAVVGPNGSGKSNVVDALAWVMGEQGAKTLRGGKMEDVIFAGAGQRKPLGRAEVTLTIDNADGALPIEYSEVSVTRRMFRDGASEYEINGQRARLMDIQELLSDSGIGREMHVIVGQGRLAQILESRPEDRRAFIEEAAGVLKHKRRKEKAQRKLTGMQANLDRLQDLTEELKKQLKPLARQAKAAKRAATVQADLRESRLRLAGHTLSQLHLAHETHAQAFSQASELHGSLQHDFQVAQESLQEAEAALSRTQPEAQAAQRLWFDLSALSERIAATSRVANERAEHFQPTPFPGEDPASLLSRAEHAEAELGQLSTAAEIAAERLDSIREEVEERAEAAAEAEREHMAQVRAIADHREGVVRLLAAQESTEQQLQAALAESQRLHEHLAEQRRQLHAASEELELSQRDAQQHSLEPLQEAADASAVEAAAAEERLEQLRDRRGALERTISKLESRIETLEANAPKPGVEGDFAPLAKFLRAQPEAQVALSAALGAFAQAVVGDPSAHSWEDVARTVVVEQGQGEAWSLDVDLPPYASWLTDHVQVDGSVSLAVYRLLADVALCPSTDKAQALVAEDPRVRAVTNDGVLVGQGWIALGRGERTALDVAAQVDQAREELASAAEELESLSGVFAGAKQAAEESRVAQAKAQVALKEAAQRDRALQQQQEQLSSRQQVLQQQVERTQQQVVAAEERMKDLEAQKAATADRLSRVEDVEDEPSTEARDEASAALAQIRAMEMEARLNVRGAQDRVEQAKASAAGLRRKASFAQQAKQQHEREQHKRAQRAQLAKTVADLAAEIAQRTAKALEKAANKRSELQQLLEVHKAAEQKARRDVEAIRQRVERAAQQRHEAELAVGQARVRLEEAQLKLSEQTGVPAQNIIEDFAPEEDFDVEQERARLQQAERDLRSLGKINPLALEEYKALEERYEFLSTQLADVEQARKDLRGVIHDVDAKILQLFSDAWRDVEAEFPKVFATLFPGGEGRLLLTDPEDMLSTGIEVEARPPGKKVKRLSLLSGGEKSLTALAMLVAIFRARPSPFYVMDEVEAALDDVNLRRLIALFEELRQDSQLIVITHQKPTMDIANVLYGVTMRGDGVTRVISQRMSRAPEQGSSVTPLPDASH
ncbi:chromosome segregation protein SMC [Corynebacterium pseudopelargi]|uniref:Chromosome partition protein Smc n=1 Tax=Corynebacterium pseudopelargi TaxID=2080757 RepID=A0A3G6IWF4_9CORY|nr:chromosome segregation protein SMC [Corynebacterium pseudopelargi]AZA08988.1 Chromosome partition protein Smc [Corynebacterium pseudopelargi]